MTTIIRRMMAVMLLPLLLAGATVGVGGAGVARKPPLGFNTWNQFACNGINAGATQEQPRSRSAQLPLLLLPLLPKASYPDPRPLSTHSRHEADRGPHGLHRPRRGWLRVHQYGRLLADGEPLQRRGRPSDPQPATLQVQHLLLGREV